MHAAKVVLDVGGIISGNPYVMGTTGLDALIELEREDTRSAFYGIFEIIGSMQGNDNEDD